MRPRLNASAPFSVREVNGVIHLSAAISIGKQPSVEQLKELRERGFASVINLRCPGEANAPMDPAEEGRMAVEAGLAYGHVPVPLEGFAGETIELFRKELSRLCEPVFVHCGEGDRAGVVAMAHLAIESGEDLKIALENAPMTLMENEAMQERVRACMQAHESVELERLRSFRWICR